MERVIGAVLLTIFLWLADSALADTPGQEESVGPQACGAFQRDTVPQSIRCAEFIDEHIESVPPQEHSYKFWSCMGLDKHADSFVYAALDFRGDMTK